MTSAPLYIEIAAGLGTGKTTLARGLAANGLCPEIESHDDNPFILKFYNDPQRHAFETEITFLMQHYHALREAFADPARRVYPAIVSDYALLLDLAYARVTLKPAQYQAFAAVFNAVRQELPRPDLLIHLKCAPEVQLTRIRGRGRDFEQSVTADYLTALFNAMEGAKAEIPDYAGDVLVVETDSLDLRSAAAVAQVFREVRRRLDLPGPG